MRQKSIRAQEAQRSTPDASDFGWDDSLYADASGRRDRGTADTAGMPAARSGGGGGDGGGDGGDGGGSDRGPRRGRGRRVLRWAAATLALLILGAAGAGYLYYEHLNRNLARSPLTLGDDRPGGSKPNAEGRTPLNILLLGSDSRNSERNLELGGARGDVGRKPLADVQLLLHVSADRSNISVVSIPRDTNVTIPRCTDPEDGTVYEQTVGTINSSLQRGGPGCTVATWMELTGIPIDHFMMIDFAGVVDMADAVGGVEVCVDDNVHDPRSGLRLEKGTTAVRGEQALQWLRTRHGFEDGSDLGRARAQRMYMGSMVRQLKESAKLTDPGKLRALAEAATKALTVDEGIGGVKDLYDLAGDIGRVPTERITLVTMPWLTDPSNPAHIIPKPGDAEKVFSLVRNDIALDGKDRGKKPGAGGGAGSGDPAAPEDEIPVRVVNGTGTSLQTPVDGRAGAVVDRLHQLGFARAAAEATPESRSETTVSYAGEDQRGDALAVAEALGLPERSVRRSAVEGPVTLVVGADWRTGTAYPADGPAGGGGEDKAPASADALGGADEDACMKANPDYVW